MGDNLVKPKFTRRQFLRASLQGSLLTGSHALTGIVSRAAIAGPTSEEPTLSVFNRKDTGTLRAAMDAIIPAAAGMPSASAAGGVSYLEQLAQSDSAIKSKLERSLKALDEVSLRYFEKEFLRLHQDKRNDALRRLEDLKPSEMFGDLRDYVYESYYTQPQIWKLIEYEFYPTNHKGPHMSPFDEAVLSKVKKMGRLYREVS